MSQGHFNTFICIDGKSVYFRNFAEKGILRMGDLISDNNELIVNSNNKLRELNISPLGILRLTSVIDALTSLIASIIKHVCFYS